MTGIIVISKASGKDKEFELEDNSFTRELRVEAIDFIRGSQSQAMNSLYESLSKAKTGDVYHIDVELEE